MRANTGAWGARPRSSISGSKVADYRTVPNVVLSCCLAFAPQLEVAPFPAKVGHAIEIRAVAANEEPLAGIAVEVRQPDGSGLPVGVTDATGGLRFVPTVVGEHVFVAVVGGVRVLAPHRVIADRRRWPLAVGCVPLGLALLWSLRRARGPRAP